MNILQMREAAEFDPDFLQSQENVCMRQSMSFGEDYGSIDDSHKGHFHKEEQERGGLEELL